MVLAESWFVKRGEELIVALKSASSNEEQNKAICSHIEWIDSKDSAKIPEFDSKLEWLNCTHPLSFENELRGKLCVLEFFTYCCINCMHIFPDLEALEQLYSDKDGLVILGVHSAKFENEKLSTNILSAILRYDIRHPVVNDSEASLWNILGVQCWPTLVVLSPEGKILLSLVGEGHKDTLIQFIGAALKFYKDKGKIRDHSIGISLSKDTLPKTSLSFPGKICVDNEGKRLVVADSGHHRILIVNSEGIVLSTIGGGENCETGFVDGSYQEARFHSPQGVTFENDVIFVADTENHAIRKINLKTEKVTTIAGNGIQGSDKEGGKIGPLQSISSPWDVTVGPPPGPIKDEFDEDILYIAMAGTHQIWALFLKDSSWLKGGSQPEGTCLRFSGSGAEENRNNSYPHKAGFAQPSGVSLALDKPFRCLFVADSESSSVRSVDVATGATKALVGADRDPTNLFAFGDQDGKGVEAKLQHPLAVAWNPHSQKLFVADSYNHKIKEIDPAKKTCATFLGTGKPGMCSEEDSVQFDEPSGLCVSPDGHYLYVADTNNHAIRVVDLQTKSVSQLNIVKHPRSSKDQLGAEERKENATVKRLTSKRTPIMRKEAINVSGNTCLEVTLNVRLPVGCYLTEGVNSKWQISVFSQLEDKEVNLDSFKLEAPSGVITQEFMQADCKIRMPADWESRATARIEALVYFCEPSGTCRMEGIAYDVPLLKTDEESKLSLQIQHEVKL